MIKCFYLSYNVHEFACKKPANGTWPTPSPTVIPEGHCRAEFQEFMGYCYSIMGLEQSVDGQQDKRNYEMYLCIENPS